MAETEVVAIGPHRPKLEFDTAHHVTIDVLKAAIVRLQQRDYRALVSRHEILGILTERYQDLIGQVSDGDMEDVEDALFQIAVAAVVGIACKREGLLDW